MIIEMIQEWFKELLIDGIISNLSGTFDTAQKVLNIHFQKSQVSKSWRLFFSTINWISS